MPFPCSAVGVTPTPGHWYITHFLCYTPSWFGAVHYLLSGPKVVQNIGGQHCWCDTHPAILVTSMWAVRKTKFIWFSQQPPCCPSTSASLLSLTRTWMASLGVPCSLLTGFLLLLLPHIPHQVFTHAYMCVNPSSGLSPEVLQPVCQSTEENKIQMGRGQECNTSVWISVLVWPWSLSYVISVEEVWHKILAIYGSVLSSEKAKHSPVCN